MEITINVNVHRLNEIAAFSEWRNFRAELALKANVSTSLINQLFCGKVPGVKSRIRISRALEVDESELFMVSEATKKIA